MSGVKGKSGKYIRTKEHNENLSNAHKGMKKPWAKGRPFGHKGVQLFGENNPCWRGGITSINKSIRSSREMDLWRISVFERDNYTCVWCGIRSQKGKKVVIHADHIKPFAYYPELRFAIDNGRTLCVECHKTTDTYAGRSINHKNKQNGK